VKVALEDRLAIEETLARYVHAIDEGDGNTWASLFTPDGSLKASGKVVGGRPALRTMVRKLYERNGDRLRHSITNVVIDEIKGDRARLRAYGLVTLWTEPPSLSTFAVYTIDMVRSDDEWKFEMVHARIIGSE
jgi:uncharacterized protein (TIGR02246 family)